MRTRRLLVCVAALGLFAVFSCAAHSDQGTRVEAKAQSGNGNSAADEKKVSVSTGNGSVEVKSENGSAAGGETKVSVSGGDGSVEVKTDDGNSVSISADGINVSKSSKESGKVEVSADDVVKISGMNQDQSYECKGRSFNVTGSSNTIKLSGQCQSLRISGASNRVDVEAVATINISGLRNQVTWERGVNNKPPSISNSGINNSVSRKGN